MLITGDASIINKNPFDVTKITGSYGFPVL